VATGAISEPSGVPLGRAHRWPSLETWLPIVRAAIYARAKAPPRPHGQVVLLRH
jgi:hypothetical protein